MLTNRLRSTTDKNQDLPVKRKIPVSEPNLCGREREYVEKCLATGWISSIGSFLQEFEKAFAHYHGVSHAIAVSNGTVALHLALLALDLGPGDEVIVPTFTYIASVNAIRYTGAIPVFVDCEPDAFNIDPALVERAITPRTKAVMVVHLYGHACDMDAIRKVVPPQVPIVEDAAEAFGSEYKGQKTGRFGVISTFSFFGNKTITTGEGGMVLTNDDVLAEKVRTLKGQGMSLTRRYYFETIGYNYRMTNIQAAIGLAQLENAATFIEKKRRIAGWYERELGCTRGILLPVEKNYAFNTYWMYSVLITEELSKKRDEVMVHLSAQGIETRPFFYAIHQLPPYKKTNETFPVAERISRQGLNLPSSTKLSRADVEYIGHHLRSCL